MADQLVEDTSERSAESLRFLHLLSTRDVNARSQALDIITRTIESWRDGYGSPPPSHNVLNSLNGWHEADVETNGDQDVAETDIRLSEQVPDLLRLSYTCPYADVRCRCKDIVGSLKEHGVPIPDTVCPLPTTFIPPEETVTVDTDNEEAQSIFVDSFLQNNRLENFIQVMAYHPQYVESFLRAHNHLLRGDGPLPYDYRHYIAIMASSRHQCSYLVTLHTREFALQGGDRQWLRGLKFVPQKLRDLSEVNKILAHRPWLITKAHIGDLLSGTDNWSVSELMHAITLLVHFHALCSFIYGCGVGDEIDEQVNGVMASTTKHAHSEVNGASPADDNHTSEHDSQSTSPDSFKENGSGVIETLMKRMKKLMEEEEEETTQEELLARFEKVEQQNAELPPRLRKPSPKANILLFIDDPDFTYQDFTKRGEHQEISTFRAQDYSWEDHGYSLANRLYSGIGSLLDAKFQVAYDLTYYTMGDNEHVDTTSFRRGIWNYIHCVFGIRHDDYNYGEVNTLLGRGLKSYIKTVTCYPERTTRADYQSFMSEFKHSEKVHVNLVLLEARLQAEFLYALRAINNYMT